MLEVDVHRIAHYDPLPTGTLTPRSLAGHHSSFAYPDLLKTSLQRMANKADKNNISLAQVLFVPASITFSETLWTG